MERDLKFVRIETQRPSRDYSNPGAIEEAMYALDDGYVQLYDMHGMSMGPEHRRKLPPHLTPNCCGRLWEGGARASIGRCGILH
jgi:hypothetical protein